MVGVALSSLAEVSISGNKKTKLKIKKHTIGLNNASDVSFRPWTCWKIEVVGGGMCGGRCGGPW